MLVVYFFYYYNTTLNIVPPTGIVKLLIPIDLCIYVYINCCFLVLCLFIASVTASIYRCFFLGLVITIVQAMKWCHCVLCNSSTNAESGLCFGGAVIGKNTKLTTFIVCWCSPAHPSGLEGLL